MVDKSVNQQVLGGIMLNPQYLSEIDKYNLSIVDFSSKLERYIYSAIYVTDGKRIYKYRKTDEEKRVLEECDELLVT